MDDDAPAPFAEYTSLVGRTITSPSGGRFRLALRRVLGVGAYGVVYLAEEIERDAHYAWYNPSAPPTPRRSREPTISTAGRMYAVKVMRCAPRGSRQRAFQAREVALHRKADGHPGVVPLYAVYGTGHPPSWSPRKRKAWSSQSDLLRREDELAWDRDAELSGALPLLDDGPEELVFMVMAYVGGGDLFTMIAERQRYIGDDALVRSVFLQLLDAVEWCHARGVKHRDLKPENILCEQDGRVVSISDFGLATTDEYSRDYGCGSSYYMSPECFGNPLTPSTAPSYHTRANDVWTLGVVLANLATGRNPWEAASPLDPTFASYCANPSEFLMSILPITPEANALFCRVFERDQTRRCGLDELRRLVEGVQRWTLRGAELDTADEGAKDVARGCGLFDLPIPTPTPIPVQHTPSEQVVACSRFSEDTQRDSSEEGEDYSVMRWYGFGTRPRSESSDSISSSSEMSRSRPVSRILSNSPTLVGPWSAGSTRASEGSGPLAEPVADQPALALGRESIPRWPKIVQGWDMDGEDEPGTPAVGSDVVEITPRALLDLTRREQLRTPRSTPSFGSPQTETETDNSTQGARFDFEGGLGLGLGLLGSPFRSKIPRYTGSNSPRARTVSFDPPRPTTREDRERERMQSAPGPAPVCNLTKKASLSTASASSCSESGFTPFNLKARVVLDSPRLIVSSESGRKVWNLGGGGRSSGSSASLWDAASSTACSTTDMESVSVRHSPWGMGVEPGAPLYDSTARLVDTRYRPRTISTPEQPQSPVESVMGTVKRVKRVPVPPIPSELLEEHERQVNLRRNGSTARVFEYSADSPSAAAVPPPPGLAVEDRPQVGPRRLLENARAWFRRI